MLLAVFIEIFRIFIVVNILNIYFKIVSKAFAPRGKTKFTHKKMKYFIHKMKKKIIFRQSMVVVVGAKVKMSDFLKLKISLKKNIYFTRKKFLLQ